MSSTENSDSQPPRKVIEVPPFPDHIKVENVLELHSDDMESKPPQLKLPVPPKPVSISSEVAQVEVPLQIPSGASYNIPIVKDINQVYKMNKKTIWRRFEKVGKKFKELYGQNVSHLIRVPAQVRVPQDMYDLGIFPSSLINLEADVLVAVGRIENSKELKVSNTEKAKHASVFHYPANI